MESFLNQFNDAQSSGSSECLNKQIRLHSSSQESLSKQSIIHQVQETKFVTDGVSQLNHDSEMVDKYNEENAGKIVRSRNDTRVVRSDISEETSRRLHTKRMVQNNVGKSTRSRNMQNPIKASFGSTDSYQKLVTGITQEQIAVDKTMDATLRRMQSRKLKRNEVSVKMQQESNDETSDFESFRNPGSEVLTNYKSSFMAGKVSKQIEGEEEIELVAEKRESDKKTRNLPLNKRKMMKNTDPGFTDDVNMTTPKIMGFFEDPMTQQYSRNTAQITYKTSTLDQSKHLNLEITSFYLSDISQTPIEPIIPLQISPRFAHEPSNTQEAPLPSHPIFRTPHQDPIHHNTLENMPSQTKKISKKRQIKANFLDSSRK